MKDKNSISIKSPEILFLSFFGSGFSPFAPGTMGTLATLPFLYGMGLYSAPFFFYIPILVIVTLISCFMAEKIQKEHNLHDPQWIVIDETLGMTTAWLFSQSHSLTHLLVLFTLFRIFDIFKIWPATYFDKKVKHGYGTILDDIVSGIYAGVVYLVLSYFIKF